MTTPEEQGPALAAATDSIRSVERAAAVIQAISAAGRSGSRLVDIAAETKLSKTTVHRLLATLSKIGWVEQDDDSGTFFLGLPLVGYGSAAADRHGLLDVAEPHLLRLAELTGDTIYLSVRAGNKALCIDQAVGSFPIRTLNPRVGDRLRLGTCAGSLALLAWLSDDDVERIIREDADHPAGNLGLESTVVRQMVDEARANGYAYFPGLLIPDSAGLGVPVLGADGDPVASLSVAAIEPRMTEPRRSQIVEWLQQEATAFSDALTELDPRFSNSSMRRLSVNN